jgi:hypothetical protein
MIEYSYEEVIEGINNQPASDRTTAKEKWGEKAIKENHLWDILFPNNLGWKKITDKRTQKLGVDFKIHTDSGDVNVDIKVCVGSNYTEGLPVEIYQRPVREADIPSSYTFTNLSSKLTDWMVYLVLDNAGFRVYKIPYSVIHAESVKYKWKTVEVMSDKGLCYKLEKHPALQKSFNRTGWFVKVMFEEYRVI